MQKNTNEKMLTFCAALRDFQIPDTPALARKRLFLGVGLMLTMFGLVCFMLAFYNYRASAILDPFTSGLPRAAATLACIVACALLTYGYRY